jgi:nitrite reductase/ring-hydroxylating ferredoxin subunit
MMCHTGERLTLRIYSPCVSKVALAMRSALGGTTEKAHLDAGDASGGGNLGRLTVPAGGAATEDCWVPMDNPTTNFVRAGTLEDLKAKGQLVVRGPCPILLVYAQGRVFAFDNRCPHMGFPLDRGSVEDGILTCHWHHARFDLASGCTFDLWADDVPTVPSKCVTRRFG